ncbi:hypothetical protein M1M34_gp095 [Haloarcula tailed virus 2]|uniref:Uncharacterized protein n=1 Tax=Haloarcula tailed virus 2 TaxID=2877989 RepID=A0AAE9BZA8_9CAUD|nr:hypothetical protein M1M34_gp095 [Haloarcula tailed virus 2]UBF23238.1 hypothetical protein HATV-2_gp87 [Haloarcula tailed virus 2]
MEIIAARLEEHYNAVLVKTVGLNGAMAHHWFDKIDTESIIYGGSVAYFEDKKTGELARISASSETTVPKTDITDYAESKGYNVIEE